MYFTIFIGLSLGFASGQCPINRCSCRDGIVDCSRRNINILPNFPSDQNFYSTYSFLDVEGYNLTSIPNGALDNAYFKKITLKNNVISRIGNSAFHGEANHLVELDLSGNKLNALPLALSELAQITKLDISGNPILSDINFTDSVMRAIGDTMLDFSFGSRDLDVWPKSLRHFPLLQRLTLNGASNRLTIIPPDGFHGFETTLLFLNIRDTHLIAVPLGISKLQNMKELHFDNNPFVGDRGILVQSFPTGASSKLQTMSLNGDSLTKFPVVLTYLPALRNLSMDDNPLFYVDDNALGEIRTVRYLSIKNCSLNRIPAAMSDFLFLKDLDISSNTINTIEENDLQDLRFLEHLVLSNNTLKYISEDAFGRVPRIKTLDFTNTALTKVPVAIKKVWPCLENVYLDNNAIDCMCETLVWLRELRDDCRHDGFPISIHGTCDTIYDNIEHYIEAYIPQCPEYKAEKHIPPYDLT